MGFNTVAMILNDHMHQLEQCPKSLTYALCNPPQYGEEAMERWRRYFREKMDETGERHSCVYPLGGINILPTFHADDVHFLYAGKNTLHRLEFLKFGKTRFNFKDHRTVTLILPEWADPRRD